MQIFHKEKLNLKDLNDRLSGLSAEWTCPGEKLHRLLFFNNFISAFSFMTQIALIAEKSNHHPEWLNIYNHLEIWLTTHEVSGVSEKDIALAKAIDALFDQWPT